ncbi:hypothetical protein ACFL20_06520 [Spirochaetota bacterium]
MSIDLLNSLNGNKTGNFRKYLDGLKEEPRIAWYPSAGTDFRALLYLHPDFAREIPASRPEPASPDLFLYTDYFPYEDSTFLDDTVIYKDDRTEITVDSIEELPGINVPLDGEIVKSPKGSKATGRVLFLEIKVNCKVLGEYTCPLIYAFVENESFCAKKLIPLNASISHIIHVRYGGGCGGGGKASGTWLLNVIKKLNCEVFITDGQNTIQSGDEAAMNLYPALSGSCEKPSMDKIRTVKSEGWSGHGDVVWNLVK